MRKREIRREERWCGGGGEIKTGEESKGEGDITRRYKYSKGKGISVSGKGDLSTVRGFFFFL